MSALSPSGTASLVPSSLPSAARAWSRRGLTAPGRSAKAKVPTISPLTRRGSQRAFWAGLP